MFRLVLAATAALMMSSAASAANEIQNGGFENPVVSGTCCNTVPPDSLPNWTVAPGGNVNVVVGTYASTKPGDPNLAAEGNQYLDLVGQGGTGSISQSFATVLGQVYSLTFQYSHNLFNPGVTSASADFSVADLAGMVAHSTGSTSNLDWKTFTGFFTGTGGNVTLNFTNTSGGTNEGILLDAISVDAVPEPGTWALMLLGFAGMGISVRRGRKQRLMQLA